MTAPPKWAAAFSSSEHAWGTPQGVVDAIAAELGVSFVLDAAALPHSAKAERWIGPPNFPPRVGLVGTDALTMPRWDRSMEFEHGDAIWLNPPYGKEAAAFVAKAKEQARLCRVPVVVLTFMRSDTAWWHAHAFGAAAWIAIKGRIGFEAPPWMDATPATAPAPSVALVFLPHVLAGSPQVIPLEIPAAVRRGRVGS